MAGTINYDHSPQDTVWVITTDADCVSLKHGTISSVHINIVDPATGSPPADPYTVWYDLFLDNNEGEISVDSQYVYAQADKALALDYYGTLIQG